MSGYEGKIPIFDGSNYAFWKRKMQMHLIAIDPDVWEVVNTGYRVIDPASPSLVDKRNIQNNAKAATAIFMGLLEHDFNRVSTLDKAKEIWDTLEQIYEGSSTLKKSKRGLLESKLERFEYEHGEDINSLFSRLTIITNQLKSLESNRVEDEDVIKKFLSVLPKPYRTLVLMLKEKDGFDQMKPTEVLGRILTHEMEIKQENKHSSSPSQKKNIALKIAASTSQLENDSSEELDEEMTSGEESELILLTRNFRKFYKKKKQFSSSDRFKGKRMSKDNKCFECGKEGHFVADCPNKKKDNNSYKKKKDFHGKKKTFNNKHPTYSKNKATARAYVGQAWVSDDSGSEEESEDEGQVAGIAISMADVPSCDTAESHSCEIIDKADQTSSTSTPLCLMAKDSKVLTEDDFPDYAELMGILERTEKAYGRERKENISLRDKLCELREAVDEVSDDRENPRLDQENLEIAHNKLKEAHELLLKEHEELNAKHDICIDNSASITDAVPLLTHAAVESCLNCASRINVLTSTGGVIDNSKEASTSTITNSVDAAEHNKLKEELEELKRLMRKGLCTANIGMQNYQLIKAEMLRKNDGRKGLGYIPPAQKNKMPAVTNSNLAGRFVRQVGTNDNSFAGHLKRNRNAVNIPSNPSYVLQKNIKGKIVARYVGSKHLTK